jgi:hypothetical protein
MNGIDHGEIRSVGFFLILMSLLMMAALGCLNAQTMVYDFGVASATHNTGESTSFLPSPPTGTARVRIGTQGGAASLANPGLAALGSGSEFRLSAATGSSLNKFSLYDIPEGSAITLRFDCVFSGGQGDWYLFIGRGATYSGNTAFSSAQVFTGLRFVVDSSGAISCALRSGNGWTPLSVSIQRDSILRLDFYCNNRAINEAYDYNGARSVAARSVDIWLNGTRIADDMAKSALPDTSLLSALMFYGASSPANASLLHLDDILWSPTIAPHPLPVELLSFTAHRRDGHVELSWRTATELNNYGFAIQRRSVGAPDREGTTWQDIGFVAGAGDAASPRSYRWLDTEAACDSVLLYRLRQIDRDGSEQLTPVVRVEAVSASQGQRIQAPYPNPAYTETTFTFHLSSPGRVRLLLFSSSGSRVVHVPTPCLLPAGRHVVPYRCADLPRGLYFCVYVINGIASTLPLLLL